MLPLMVKAAASSAGFKAVSGVAGADIGGVGAGDGVNDLTLTVIFSDRASGGAGSDGLGHFVQVVDPRETPRVRCCCRPRPWPQR